MKTGTAMIVFAILSLVIGSLIYVSVTFNDSHILKVSKNKSVASVIEKKV